MVYTEPLFVVAIMAIASTRPVLDAAEAAIGGVAARAGGREVPWWRGFAPSICSVSRQ